MTPGKTRRTRSRTPTNGVGEGTSTHRTRKKPAPLCNPLSMLKYIIRDSTNIPPDVRRYINRLSESRGSPRRMPLSKAATEARLLLAHLEWARTAKFLLGTSPTDPRYAPTCKASYYWSGQVDKLSKLMEKKPSNGTQPDSKEPQTGASPLWESPRPDNEPEEPDADTP